MSETYFDLLSRLDKDPFAASRAYEARLREIGGTGEPRSDEERDALLAFAFASAWAGRTAEALAALGRLALEPALLPRSRSLLARVLRADMLANQERMASARADLDDAVEALARGELKDEPLAEAFVREVAGWALLRGFNDHAGSQPVFKAAYDYWEAEGRAPRMAACLAGLAAIHERRQDGAASVLARREALQMLGEGELFIECWMSHAVGQDAYYSGDMDLAWSMFTRAKECAERPGTQIGSCYERLGLANVAAARGQWELCASLAAEAYPDFMTLGIALSARQCVGLRAQALCEWRPPGWREQAQLMLGKALEGLDESSPHALHRKIFEHAMAGFEALGMAPEALGCAKRLLALERRFANEEREKQIAEVEALFGIEAKERDRRNLRDLFDKQTLSAKIFERLAMEDPLTGAPNRRKALEVGEAARARAAQSPHWVAILDIDHFKAINDRHGHEVGDKALRDFYELSRAALPQECHLGRVGGEEWLVIWPRDGKLEPAEVFARARAALEPAALPGGEPLRFSMGACPLSELAPLQASLSRADAALYAAKSAGRDQCKVDLGAASTRRRARAEQAKAKAPA